MGNTAEVNEVVERMGLDRMVERMGAFIYVVENCLHVDFGVCFREF